LATKIVPKKQRQKEKREGKMPGFVLLCIISLDLSAPLSARQTQGQNGLLFLEKIPLCLSV
jgi:hypothetical protein